MGEDRTQSTAWLMWTPGRWEEEGGKWGQYSLAVRSGNSQQLAFSKTRDQEIKYCPSAVEWLNKLQYTYTTKLCASNEKYQLELHQCTWVDFYQQGTLAFQVSKIWSYHINKQPPHFCTWVLTPMCLCMSLHVWKETYQVVNILPPEGFRVVVGTEEGGGERKPQPKIANEYDVITCVFM